MKVSKKHASLYLGLGGMCHSTFCLLCCSALNPSTCEDVQYNDRILVA